MRPVRPVPLALLGFALAAAPAHAATVKVSATPDNTFSPSKVTIAPGDTVAWHNDGGEHNVKFDDGSFTQPPKAIITPWDASRTFSTAGSFRYYCEAHGDKGGVGMSGVVTVQGAPGSAPTITPVPPTVETLRARAAKNRSITIRFRASFASTATVTVARRTRVRSGRARFRFKSVVRVKRSVGDKSVRLTVSRDRRRRRLLAGRYRVSVQLKAGGSSGPVRSTGVTLR